MATIEQRIVSLELTHFGKNPVNVFIRRFAGEVPITRATHGDLTWYKRENESQEDFEKRAVCEARAKYPRNSPVRVFCLWLSAGESVN